MPASDCAAIYLLAMLLHTRLNAAWPRELLHLHSMSNKAIWWEIAAIVFNTSHTTCTGTCGSHSHGQNQDAKKILQKGPIIIWD